MRTLATRWLTVAAFMALSLALLCPGTAGATSLSLQDLFDGESLTVHDKVFSDWSLDPNSIIGTTPNFSMIGVVPLADDPSNPGLRYVMNGQFSVGADEFVLASWSFSVATLSGNPLIKDNSLALTDFSLDDEGALVSVDESVHTLDEVLLAEKAVCAETLDPGFCTVQQLFDSAEFDPESAISVTTSVAAVGGLALADTGGTASLDAFEQRFSQVEASVPEPASLLLLSSGLAGLAARQWRRTPRMQAS